MRMVRLRSGMRRSSLPGKLTLSAWCFWLAMLLGTPFFLSDPLPGAAYSNRYVFVAVGLLAGCLVAPHLRTAAISPKRVMALCGTLGAAAALLAVVPEWALLKLYYTADPSDVQYYFPQMIFDLYRNMQPFALALSSLLAVLVGRCALSVYVPKRAPQALDTASALLRRRMAAVVFAAPLAAGVIGFLRVSLPALVDGLANGALAAGVPLLAYAPALVSLAAFFAIAALFCAFVFRLSDKLSLDDARTASLFVRVLASFAAGMACWNVVTRVLPVLGEPPYWVAPNVWAREISAGASAGGLLAVVAMLAGMGLWMACLARFERRQITDEPPCPATRLPGTAREDAEGGKRACIDRHCSEAGLTERESTAVVLLLEGRTSAQSAEDMKVMPQTVRTYLQRAYKKFDVRSGKDLVRLLGRGDPLVSPAVKRDQSGTLSLSGWRGAVVLVGACALILAASFALLPHTGGDHTWGSGRETLVGASIALLVYGAMAYHASWVQRFVAPEEQIGCRRASRGARAFVGLYVGLGVAALGCGLSMIGAQLLRTMDGAAPFVFFLSALALAAGACLGAHAASSLASPGLKLPGEAADAGRRAAGARRLLSGALYATCAAYGLVWQASWRGMGHFPTEYAVSLFSVFGIAAAVVYFWRCSAARLAACFGIAAIAVAVFSAVVQSASPLFAASFLLFMLEAAHAIRARLVGLPKVCAGMVLVACGCLAGMFMTDAVDDILSLRNPAAAAFFGSGQTVDMVVAFGWGVVLLMSFAAVCLLCRALLDKKLTMLLFDGTEREGADSTLSAVLARRGLNATQVSIALGILHGLTAKEISEQLNYSAGTVNTARSVLYKTFAVHSRAELASLLLKEIS